MRCISPHCILLHTCSRSHNAPCQLQADRYHLRSSAALRLPPPHAGLLVSVSVRSPRLTDASFPPAGVVSGFKEIRFVAGRAFPLETGYALFESFVEWLMSLCDDVKVRGCHVCGV